MEQLLKHDMFYTGTKFIWGKVLILPQLTFGVRLPRMEDTSCLPNEGLLRAKSTDYCAQCNWNQEQNSRNIQSTWNSVRILLSFFHSINSCMCSKWLHLITHQPTEVLKWVSISGFKAEQRKAENGVGRAAVVEKHRLTYYLSSYRYHWGVQCLYNRATFACQGLFLGYLFLFHGKLGQSQSI